MEFRKIKLGRLELNKGQVHGLPANPRKWTKGDVVSLARSMEETPELAEARGAIVYPVGSAFVVLGGNMRVEAARHLGWPELMCAVLPETTPTEKLKQIVLKDNSSFGAWDVDLLKADWGEFEFMDIGIKLPDLPPKGNKKARDDGYDPSRILGRKTPPKTKRGDLIQLGEHLLICADTKDVHALEKLMGGGNSLADLLVTDPPYNVAISNSDGKTIENDDMSDGAFRDFLYGCFVAVRDCLKAGAACYIWMASSEIDACIEAYEKAGLLYKQLLIWVKNSFTLGRQDYQWQHESCVYGWKPGAGHYFSDSRRESTVKEDKLDSLSFLKAVLRQQDLDYCLASTWCMGAEDILQFREWVEADRIKKLDIYVGEIFSGSYAVEFQMLKRLYQDHPDLGRFALFRNHSKVYAGTGPLWSFGIQSSANINTNPRTENTCITIDRGLFEFYKKYYDGIKSFE